MVQERRGESDKAGGARGSGELSQAQGVRNCLGALAPMRTPAESSLKKRVVARSAHSGDYM